MQCRINQDGFFAQVNTEFFIHTQHTGQAFLNGTFAMDNFNHRSVKPQCYTVKSFNTITTSSTFTNDGSCRYVASFQGVHESFTIAIYQLCTEGAYFFSNECAVNLSGVRNAGRMILDSVFVNQGSTCTISHNQTVSSCTVVVGSREALIM